MIKRPGYQDIRLESLNPEGHDSGQLEALILDGAAAEDPLTNLKERRRNAASVHLSYKAPTNAIAAFYCEVTAVEEPVTTFSTWPAGGTAATSACRSTVPLNGASSSRSGTAVTKRSIATRSPPRSRVQLMGKGDGVFSGD
ncbi:MAG UNVERIFIED_CONTAM: DUF5077 domain-containing protein, partial [Planctomycetaceae bacterium]